MKKFFFFLLLVPALLVQADSFYTVSQIMDIYNELGLSDGATSSSAYTVRGYVTRWKSGYPTYQNADFFIDDAETGSTSKLECFRLTAQNAEDKRELSKGNYVEVTGKLKRYGNQAELVSGTFRVLEGEAWTPVPISIREFIDKNDGKRYILTGVVTEIKSTQYGNLYLEDNTGSIYVYGISGFSNYGIEVSDTLTISGIYQLYGSTHEVTGGQYISHKKPAQDQPTELTVDFDTDFAGGWEPWIGKTVTFTNDFYFCDSWNNTIAPHRLRAPEEYGAEGTAAYKAALAQNTHDSCHLVNPTISYKTYRLGTVIRNLKAYVSAANRLQAVNSPDIINNEFPTVRPDLGDANVVVCAANVENFFVDNIGTGSSYHGASDANELAVQKKKIVSALYHMNADIYALCEVEQGPNALNALVSALNEQAGANVFARINTGASSYNSGMVCFIYRKDKLDWTGSYLKPYTNYAAMNHREAIQCFKHLATGEKFNVAMNHFFAKSENHGAADRESNMQYLINKLPMAENTDPDVLVVGDLNAYTMEVSNRMLVDQKNYVDLLMKYDPNGYSHMFDCMVGFLDHAYCSPSMESQITKAVSYHLNADTWKNGYSYTSGNESMYRYSDHDPILVGIKLVKPSAEGIDDIDATEECQKILRHGQLIIIRSGVEYTVTGQRVR